MTHSRSNTERRRPRATRRVAIGVLAACGLCVAAMGCTAKTEGTRATTTTEAVEVTAPSATDAPTTMAPSGPPDPCKVATLEQISALVHLQMPEPTPVGQGDNLMCQWVSPPTGPTAQVEIFTGEGAHKSFQIDHDTLGHDFTQLEGIGDEAWLEDDNVFLRKGDMWAQVNVVALDVDEADIRSGLTDLARTIAANL